MVWFGVIERGLLNLLIPMNATNNMSLVRRGNATAAIFQQQHRNNSERLKGGGACASRSRHRSCCRCCSARRRFSAFSASSAAVGHRTKRSEVVERYLSTLAGMVDIRQNYHEDCEMAINTQINMELRASYTYLSMAYYMNRHDVALPGLFEYFKKASDEEREHAMKFMEYQNKRGGSISLTSVDAPSTCDWGGAKNAMAAAFALEKDVNESLLSLHSIASERKDAHLCDFLETEFLDEQVRSIKELADHLSNLELVGDGLGVYLFDKHFDKKH